ncbi:MAG: ArsA family ATPase [Candidatus Sericytochromatia bacterium]|nr:ArsA family ATPase [Candidatus Sericytochromatia bacterium]
MRTILYTGKGGVGKTTISAATALRSAQRGHRTLVMSTDMAHSLADSLGTPLGSEPTLIAENLWGQEINVLDDIRKYWGEVQGYLAGLLITRGFDDVVADEMAVLPGMEELCSLMHLNEKSKQGLYDVIICDMAPTAESVRLLSLPDIIDWYVNKVMTLSKTAGGILAPILKTAMILPGGTVVGAIQDLLSKIDGLKEQLSDPEQTSIRLVLNPEKMVIKEAQRAFTYLNLFGYNVDLVVSNRILPPTLEGSFFHRWREQQNHYRDEVTAAFAPVPILEVPLMEQEIVGLEMLGRIADELFPEQDPAEIFYTGQSHRIYKEDGNFYFEMKLPFVDKTAFNLLKKGDELIVEVGNIRRDIILPRALAHLQPGGATLENGLLKVKFPPA